MTVYALEGKRIWVAGHSGMVGSALVRRLTRESCEVITVGRGEVDLRNQAQTTEWLHQNKPDAIFVAAATVGGIMANSTYPVDFLYNNIMIAANVIEAARCIGVEKLLYLGSSCIYPKLAEQPIVEESLLTGPLEPTNEWYAVAKITGLKLVQAYRRQYGCQFISAMPTNLYGPYDNFDLNSSHVMPALIRKAHEAKLRQDPDMTIWGTGGALREFLYVDDCADACVHLMKTYSHDMHINIGSGSDLSILELTKLICKVVGYHGRFVHDLSKPDGTPRKLMSAARLRALGWAPLVPLEQGIAATYRWFCENAQVEHRPDTTQA